MTQSSKPARPLLDCFCQEKFNELVKSEGLPRARRIFESMAHEILHANGTKVDPTSPTNPAAVSREELNRRLVGFYENMPETPPNNWSVNGEVDPHKGHYDQCRKNLTLGWFTDDELANGAFMHYNDPLDLRGITAGTSISPIGWMTAVKDRIRWLSRKLMKAESDKAILLRAMEDNVQITTQSLNDRRIYVVKVCAADSHGMPSLEQDTLFIYSTTNPVGALRAYYEEVDKKKE